MKKYLLILLCLTGIASGYFEISEDVPTVFSASGGTQWRMWAGGDLAEELFNNSSGILFDDARQSVIAGKFTPGAAQEAVSTFGYFAGQGHSVGTLSSFGAFAGQYNRDIDGSHIGYLTGRYNLGLAHTALGVNAGRANEGDNNTALGAYSFDTFSQDAGSAATVQSVDTVNNQITTVGAHGFAGGGGSNVYINLMASTTDTLPTGITAAFPQQWEIINATVLELLVADITDSGTGTHTLTPRVTPFITNSTAVGVNAEPTASNQVMLGNLNVTEVKTAGGLTLGGTLDMSDNPIIDVGYMDFNLLNGIAQAEGRLVWNDDDGTLNLGMPGGEVNLQIGQEMMFRGRNESGGNITNGQAVRITGGVGGPPRPKIGLADADDPAAAGSVGLATEDINNNTSGYVTTSGLVRGLNTLAFSVGDRLYVSNTAGGLTATPPTGTERIIFIGIVIVDSVDEGVIWVNPINVSYLDELSGITIASVADNDLLAYDSGSGIWINQDPVEAGFDSIYLRRDGTTPLTGNWSAGAFDVDFDTDVLVVDSTADRVQVGGTTGNQIFSIIDDSNVTLPTIELQDLDGQVGLDQSIGRIDFFGSDVTGKSRAFIDCVAENAAGTTYALRFFLSDGGAPDQLFSFGSGGNFGLGDVMPIVGEQLLYAKKTNWFANVPLVEFENLDAFPTTAGNVLKLKGGASASGSPEDSYMLLITQHDDTEVLKVDGKGDITLSKNIIHVPSAVTNITAAGGITVTNAHMRIQGDGGPIDITANPQIAAGTDGQVLMLEGHSNTNTVKIDQGDGIHMYGGNIVLGLHDVISFQYDSDSSEWQEISSNSTSSEKSWAFMSRDAGSGTSYVGGFYQFQNGTSTFVAPATFGTANLSYAAHAFLVCDSSPASDSVIRVSGTSITDGGVRAAGDTEDLTFLSTASANDYKETPKKWLGQVTFTFISGDNTVLYNRGFCKYWDNNNTNYQVIGFEATWLGAKNDATPDIKIRHHRATGWTFTGTTPTPPAEIASMATDHNTEIQIGVDQEGAWKRDNLFEDIDGSADEGVIIELVTTTNRTYAIGNFMVRVRPK